MQDKRRTNLGTSEVTSREVKKKQMRLMRDRYPLFSFLSANADIK